MHTVILVEKLWIVIVIRNNVQLRQPDWTTKKTHEVLHAHAQIRPPFVTLIFCTACVHRSFLHSQIKSLIPYSVTLLVSSRLPPYGFTN